eukprot:m.1231241 g.1231241  ORF g.1231241 m.1231241 type:complete len:1417 (+) comp24658_c0_seq1:93-4343(+)
MATFTASESSPPLAAVIVAKLGGIPVAWGKSTAVEISGTVFDDAVSAAKILARLTGVYGGPANDAISMTETDHWITFAEKYTSSATDATTKQEMLNTLEGVLSLRTYLVGHAASLADAAVFAAMYGATDVDTNTKRWVDTCMSLEAFASTATKISAPKASTKNAKQEGKFIELTDVKEGEVVTRFPPEASGYMHVGHAKAAIINEYLARTYKGKMILRFDDTNPAKESEEFERVIQEDLNMLNVKPDHFSRTSDHFDALLEHAEKLIKAGKAFVDDSPAEKMQEERYNFKPSSRRDASVEDNMRLWQGMKSATEEGLRCCLRIKIDYKSENGAMRDPTIYRCKPEPHLSTGTKYKVYPTYDFACPLVDSIEGVTHAARTTEYHDRNDQYDFIAKACGVRVPRVLEFSRLAFINTCMSKRQLAWFVENKRVDGWSDPRFPTVRGILRRGLTLEGLRKFIISQGASQTNALMEWDKIWAINRQVIDPLAPRHTALLKEGLVTVTVKGATTKQLTVNLHPKNPDVGTKTVWCGEVCTMELSDAVTLEEGEKITLMDLGNVRVTSITRQYGMVTAVEVEVLPDDKDFAGTKKITWLPAVPEEQAIEVKCIEYAPLINVVNVAKADGEEGLKKACPAVPQKEYTLVGSSSLANIKQGDIVQINRRGFWICDEAPHADLGRPCVLIDVPDGKKKESALAVASAVAVSPADLQEAEEAFQQLSDMAKDMRKSKQDKDAIKSVTAKAKIAEDMSSLMRSLAAKSASIAAPAPKASTPAKETTPKSTGGASGKKTSKPAAAPKEAAVPAATSAPAAGGDDAGADILRKVTEQGVVVRDLKKGGTADKETIAAAVEVLLALKAEYKKVTGNDVPQAGRGGGGKKDSKKSKSEGAEKKPKEKKPKQAGGGKEKKENKNVKGETKLKVDAKKDEDLPSWYTQTIVKAEMIEYYDISGCYILRPAAYCIWDFIKEFFDGEIKKLGVENSYFPMFVPQKALELEKDHIEDFAPEVAWVTRSGQSELAEPIAIRPTSETVMYPSFRKWIQSHRDLPLRLNQWCNVVRWEFKQPQPFLRTREFLWQEGHTAYLTAEAAGVEVMQILELYARVYEELLAVPVVKGRKTEKEKFAGGDYTTTVEAYIPAAGRAIQGATSHHLGQNFAKMFKIEIENPEKPDEKQFVYQNSWGLTTRTIGVMVMVHGDDKGLVVPPRVARYQVVLIPTGIAGKNAPVAELKAKLTKLAETLRAAGVRCTTDFRDNYTPAWKYNDWELKGVPLRLELGPRDMEQQQVVIVRRDNGVKQAVPENSLVETVPTMLEAMQSDMYARALKERDASVVLVDEWSNVVPRLNEKKLLQIPFCGGKDCEGQIKELTANAATEGEDVDENAPSMGAKSLCIPFSPLREVQPGEACIRPGCDAKAQCIAMFGRSY